MQIINSFDYFENKNNISKFLYSEGKIIKNNKIITVVGTRRPTKYGILALNKIISGLSEYPISIISGLAIGIDSAVHEISISNNIHTIAIPGSSIEKENIYPRKNLKLSEKIINSGGCLISVWENQRATKWTFPFRNKIMANMSDLVIIIECRKDSGTMITANEAIKRNIPVCAIPGNIDNIYSEGPNYLLKNGAKCITESEDILKLLNIKYKNIFINKETNKILDIIKRENINAEGLALQLHMPISEINIELTMMEISKEIIIENNGNIRAV